MQEQAYLSSHLADEFFRTDRGSPDPYGLDDAREPSVENFPSEEGTPSRQKSGRAAGASGRGGSLDPAFWEEPDISQIKVGGTHTGRWKRPWLQTAPECCIRFYANTLLYRLLGVLTRPPKLSWSPLSCCET
jgi:hypothetical protein